MVAVIKTAEGVTNAIHYNENKLKQGTAKLIHSNNYAKTTEELGFSDKLRTLEKLIALNERTKLNGVHISLNFDPSEKILVDRLQKIADRYMQQIGFGNQPYLVYEHFDAGHPHIHIVTTNIQWDGSRIKMQNIGRNQSEKARVQIEQDFGLVKAESRQRQNETVMPVNVQKVQYGKTDTRRAITNVLDAVLPVYKYASLPELNAVLKLYNIKADRGAEHSRMYDNKGLLYRILNDKGENVGVPIKSSQIYSKPTLTFLEHRFRENQRSKQGHQVRLKNAIDLYFKTNQTHSIGNLMQALHKGGIHTVLRQNETGMIYGITYVDHHTKCVFNGSDLGKAYSAKQVQERCDPFRHLRPEASSQLKPENEKLNPDATVIKNETKEQGVDMSLKEITKALLTIEQESGLAAELKSEDARRKKKKLRHS